MPTSPGVTTVGLTTAHNCIAKPVSHCSSGADRLALPYSISNGQWRDTEVAWQGFPRDSSRQAQVSPPWWERPPACLSASQRGLGFSGAHWKTLLHSFQSNCEQDGGGGLKHSIQIKYPSWKLNKFRITRILYIVHNLGEIFILNTLSMILFFSFYHNVQVCKVCFKANLSECLYDDGQVLQPLCHQLLLMNVHPQCSSRHQFGATIASWSTSPPSCSSVFTFSIMLTRSLPPQWGRRFATSLLKHHLLPPCSSRSRWTITLFSPSLLSLLQASFSKPPGTSEWMWL